MTDPAALARSRALAFLATARVGERVVVRAHDGSGAVDALGDLVAASDAGWVVRTRRGDVVVQAADVIAAKPVPPAPPRRH